MPTIINPYAANDSIAASLGKLGEAMFGNGAKHEHERQSAFSVEQDVRKKSRENTNVPLLADALARGDFESATRYGVNADRKPTDVAGYGQYYGVNKYGPASDAGVRATMAVPGANYGNTIPGERERLANASSIAEAGNASHERIGAANNATTLTANEMTTKRQMELAQWQDEHAPTTVRTPDGRLITVSKAEARSLMGQGYTVPQSLDQVKAELVSPTRTAPQAAAAPAPQPTVDTATDFTAPMPAPTMAAQPPAAAPQPGGTANLTQDQRAIVGLPGGVQHFVNTQTGEVGISHDGGQTLTTAGGNRIPAAGSGFQPTDSAAALLQLRNNNMRNEVRMTPAPGAFDPNTSQLAQDAYKASGMDAGATRHLNATVGAIPGVGPMIGEIGAPTERATERLQVAANAARTALLTNDFRQGKWSQQQIDAMLPLGSSFANPVTAGNSLGAVVQELAMEEKHLRNVIESPNTPPDLKHKAFAAWQQTHRAIALFTAPVQQAQPAAAPQAAAPAPAAAAAPAGPTGGLQPGQSTVINGVTIQRVN